MSEALPTGLLVETPAAKISRLPARARLSLRARGELSALNGALGLSLPGKIGQRSETNQLEALCLGPDEWVLLAADTAPIISACATVYETTPHSIVDISAREISLQIEGPRATELLTIGCPRDPESIKIGDGRRTLFDGATVILWRDGQNSYRLDVWNSFASHLFDLLETGCRELTADQR